MNAAVIVLGLAVLVILAAMIGLASDRQARDAAWRRIAEERRRIWKQTEAFRAAPRCGNPDCPFRDGQDPPQLGAEWRR